MCNYYSHITSFFFKISISYEMGIILSRAEGNSRSYDDDDVRFSVIVRIVQQHPIG